MIKINLAARDKDEKVNWCNSNKETFYYQHAKECLEIFGEK